MRNLRSIAFLLTATLASAILSATIKALLDVELFTGFFFGMALAVYFAVYERWENLFDIGWLVAACTVAYPAAYISSVGICILTGGAGMGDVELSTPILFGGGLTGAVTLGTAAMWRFAPPDRRSFMNLALLGIGGGILGVIGGAAAGSRDYESTGAVPLLYLIWQPGMGVLLAWVFARYRPKLLQSAKSSYRQT